MSMRSLAETVLAIRSRLANVAGKTFGDRRDVYKALGYKRELTPSDYRSRYKRNGVANRIVKAFPSATWRGGADIIEDKDPNKVTPFEQAFIDLDMRLKIWDKLKRADTLAGIGRYAVLLIGAPGELDQPLVTASFDDIMYFSAFAEEDAPIQAYEGEPTSPRFGFPTYYTLKRTSIQAATGTQTSLGIGKKTHWSRVIHISDGLLDDNIFGEPRLECVWNFLDDLEKVVGGGGEAFWMRANQGLQLDLDPTLNVSEDQKAALRTQLEEYEHELRRTLLTRGVKINELGSDVADFKSPVEAIMSLISAGTGIPQRVLMGSEQGKLAARQDRANWDNRVMDRQKDLAGPMMVRPLVDRLIELGAVPPPKAGQYEVRFSSITTMDDEQRAETAKAWAGLNQAAGQTIVTANEIRERVLDLPPLKDVLSNEPGSESIVGQGQGGQPQVLEAPSEEALLAVLEAAIESDHTDVVDHILGIRRAKTETEGQVVLQQLETLQAHSPALEAEIKLLAGAIAQGFTKQPAAPNVQVDVHVEKPEAPNVLVQVPAQPRTRKVIMRDARGLITAIEEEEV